MTGKNPESNIRFDKEAMFNKIMPTSARKSQADPIPPIKNPIIEPVKTKPEPEIVSVPEPVSEPIPKPIPEPIPKPIPEPIPKPIPEPLPEPVSESIPEPVSELVPEPVSESIPEPVPESIPEPVSEPVPEPVPEPLPEPISEPRPEPPNPMDDIHSRQELPDGTIMFNASEKAILNKRDTVLERFNCCKCDKCKNTVTTIALNKIKPEYVIANSIDELDEYASKVNDSEIVSALIQAILTIMTHPRH